MHALESSLILVELRLQQQIEYPRRPIKFVYFPETGLFSVFAMENERQIEVGLIGQEGMTGLPILLGDDRSPHACVVQAACTAYELSSDDLRSAMDHSLPLRELMTKYAHAAMIQMGYSALANGQASIEERLARWLLMSQDRIGDELALTHELLAYVLGVRRAGVTDALHVLEGRQLIRTSRGRIFITNRAGLKQVARGLYGTPEAEYYRLTGIPIERFGVPITQRPPTEYAQTELPDPDRDVLGGRRVLIVEEDDSTASKLAQELSARGAVVVGPVSTLEAALRTATDTRQIDVAVLDLNLQGDTVHALVDILEGSGAIVIFAMDHDSASIPPRYSQFPHCFRPLNPTALIHELTRLAFPATKAEPA